MIKSCANGYTGKGECEYMTVKELYEWAKNNNAENMEIEIQYRDSGGFYYGRDIRIEPEIDESCCVNGRSVIVL